MRSVDYCFSFNPVNYRRKWISFLVRLIHHIMDGHEWFCIKLFSACLREPGTYPLHLFLFSLPLTIPFQTVETSAPFRRHAGLTCAKHGGELDRTLSTVTCGVTRSWGRVSATCSGQCFRGSCWSLLAGVPRCGREDPDSHVHWGSTRFFRHWGMSEKSQVVTSPAQKSKPF